MPVDAFSAAQIVHTRLRRLFAGAYQNVRGLTFTAPTEYLGMLGMSEAVLYVLRLYESVLQAALAGAAPKSPEEERITREVVFNKERIEIVVAMLARGYDADPLMRQLPGWLSFMEDSGAAAQLEMAAMHGSSAQEFNYCMATKGPPLQNLVSYFSSTATGGAATEATSTVPATTTFATLSNGVQMPLMGLGTWQLQGELCQEAVLQAITEGYR